MDIRSLQRKKRKKQVAEHGFSELRSVILSVSNVDFALDELMLAIDLSEENRKQPYRGKEAVEVNRFFASIAHVNNVSRHTVLRWLDEIDKKTDEKENI